MRHFKEDDENPQDEDSKADPGKIYFKLQQYYKTLLRRDEVKQLTPH